MSPRTSLQNEQIKEQRRQAILEAALAVFAQRGYAASTIDVIAKEAGTSKGLVYNYFSSKQELLKAIFEDILGQTEGMWQFDEVSTPKQKLKKLLDGTFTFFSSQQQLLKLMTQLALQDDALGELRTMIDGAQSAKFAIMEPLFKEMGIRNPTLETFTLGALLDGIALGYLALKEEYPLQEIKKSIYDKYDLI